MAFKQSETGYRVILRGVVQGVGFRPFVYREAIRFNIRGTVRNHDGDVEILASGGDFSGFLDSLEQNRPSGSWIDRITVSSAQPFEANGFNVARSYGGGRDTPRFFSPDIAICDSCMAELFDGATRRAGHYFINCAVCGPRFSLLKAFPYDRANTTMETFPVCDGCLREYDTPEDPRFHAETICCNDCGPVLLYNRAGVIYEDNEAFRLAIEDLPDGIAIKGIGGYHLACSPYDAGGVWHLRSLKAREKKPFAIMFRDIATIAQICELSKAEEELLNSPARPIVLLKMKRNPFSEGVLDVSSGRCGCFLPYTALQYLLLDKMPCLILTSANRSSSPMICDDRDILALTDRVLYHKRVILRGVEDSVMQIAADGPRFIRRGRGHVPLPVSFVNPADISLLAVGGDLKASFGLLKRQAFIQSQPLGDLENDSSFNHFKYSIEDLEELFAITPDAVVCDAHPRYFSSELAKQLSVEHSVPVIKVFHHHAHIASVMAEHRLSRVLGVAMDGAGYGEDGHIWGGEFLICEEESCHRAGHLSYTKVIGADTAARDAGQTAQCYLHAYGLSSSHPDRAVIDAALDHGINTYQTSSLGRLFDAVSYLLGISQTNSYEGECAARLQYRAEEEKKAGIIPSNMRFSIETENGMHICRFHDIITKCLTGAPGAALGFHNAVCDMITQMCVSICDEEGIIDIALSGGVFQNSMLLENVVEKLSASGFNIFTNELVPPNDGGLALGQAFVGIRLLNPPFKTSNPEL